MIASISQFKIIIALSLTLAACCAGAHGGAAPGSVAAIAQMLNLNNYKPSNGCKCGGTGYLAACSKANRWLALFGASTTCKPNDRDHLQEWHDPCPRGRPHGYRATRRRLSIWQYLNEMIGNVGREVKIQRGMQRLYKCLGKKPQPHVLMDLLNATQGWPGNHGLEPPLTKTEAFEYLIAFKPTRRRLTAQDDMLNGVVSGVRKERIIQQRMQQLYSDLGERPTAYELVKFVKSDFVRFNIDGKFKLKDAYKYLKHFEPSRRRLNANSEARAAIKKEITDARCVAGKSSLAMRNAKYRLMEEWDLDYEELEAIIAEVCPST